MKNIFLLLLASMFYSIVILLTSGVIHFITYTFVLRGSIYFVIATIIGGSLLFISSKGISKIFDQQKPNFKTINTIWKSITWILLLLFMFSTITFVRSIFDEPIILDKGI